MAKVCIRLDVEADNQILKGIYWTRFGNDCAMQIFFHALFFLVDIKWKLKSAKNFFHWQEFYFIATRTVLFCCISLMWHFCKFLLTEHNLTNIYAWSNFILTSHVTWHDHNGVQSFLKEHSYFHAPSFSRDISSFFFNFMFQKSR